MSFFSCVEIQPREMTNDLNGLAAEWRMFGVQLKMDTDRLDAIAGDRSPAATCFSKILETWLQSVNTLHTKKNWWKL